MTKSKPSRPSIQHQRRKPNRRAKLLLSWTSDLVEGAPTVHDDFLALEGLLEDP